MAGVDNVFAGSLVALYDSVLGPFMFEPFACEMAQRQAQISGDVLEIAAGTGILTRELDKILAAGSSIVATDLNGPMLARAAQRLTSPRVTWRQADALALPFERETFDAAICQFGIMFYPDQIAGHREAHRVLRPGGCYALSVWDDLKSNPVADVVHRTVADCFPNDPPQFFARTPHGHHDVGTLRGSLAAAGFAKVSADKVTLPAGRVTADQLALGFCQGTPLRHEIEQRTPKSLVATTEAVAQSLRNSFGDGEIESTIQAHVIVAIR